MTEAEQYLTWHAQRVQEFFDRQAEYRAKWQGHCSPMEEARYRACSDRIAEERDRFVSETAADFERYSNLGK